MIKDDQKTTKHEKKTAETWMDALKEHGRERRQSSASVSL